MLRRLMLVPIVGAIALLLLAGPASAAPKVPNVEPFTVTFDPGELCKFEVELKVTDGQVKRTTLPDGTVIVTGPAVVTITNLENGSSATFNISGPLFTQDGDVILTGPTIILLLAEFAPPGPGILATEGRGTIEDRDFDIEGFTGSISDVCAQLA
jgi:hypothetical protein